MLCMTAGALRRRHGDRLRLGAEVGGRLLCCTFSPPTIQSSYVAIAMYLTSYVMLLRRPAIAPAEWVGGELRWYVACVCDPELN